MAGVVTKTRRTLQDRFLHSSIYCIDIHDFNITQHVQDFAMHIQLATPFTDLQIVGNNINDGHTFLLTILLKLPLNTKP
jgi:hypothetical protein